MPQATSAWPADVEPVCGSAVGALHAVDQSAVEAAAVCGGGATRPSSATTTARVPAGSMAIAGLCSIWDADSAAISGESQAPRAGAETSSATATPTTSTST